MGGRGSSTSFLQVVEAHSGLALQTTQLLDQREAAGVNTVCMYNASWMESADVFVYMLGLPKLAKNTYV